MRVRMLVAVALAGGCAIVFGLPAAASGSDGYHRVTVDEVPCEECGGPVPVGISLLVPAGWEIHRGGGSVAITDAQNPKRFVSFGPAFVWRSGLPSPNDVRAYLADTAEHGQVKYKNVTVKRTNAVAGVPGILQSLVLGKMQSVTYLFEGRSFPVIALGFVRPIGRDAEFDAAMTTMIRGVEFIP